MVDADDSAASGPCERVFTWPLVVFLLLVVGFDAIAAYRRYSLPGLGDSIELLADGDADSEERDAILLQVAQLGPVSGGVREQWAGMMAAIALEDRATFDRAMKVLGGPPVPTRIPVAAEREFLGLGDTMLANITAALLAEVEGDRPGARVHWQQVVAQSRLTGRTLAGELAVAALARLP